MSVYNVTESSNIKILMISKESEEKEYNEIGCEVQNYFITSVTYVDQIECKCPICDHACVLDDDSADWCDRCDEFNEFMADYRSNIKEYCKNFEIDIDNEFPLDFYTEKYKIKVLDLYGVMTCFIEDEPNEWSSTPHNNFSTSFYLFKSESNRNKYYDNY